MLIAAALAVPLGAMILHLGGSEERYGGYLLTFALFMVVQCLCIVPHELGHALAALLLGMRLFTVCIGGSGKPAFAIRVLGYDVVFMTIPLGGSTLAFPKDAHFVRLKQLVFVLGGPTANILLIFLAMWLGSHYADEPNVEWAISVFVGSNLLVLAVNLFPHTVTVNGQQVPSDGLYLLTAAFISKDRIKGLHAAYFALEGLEARERGYLDGAKEWFERGLAIYPDDFILSSGMATLHLDAGEYGQAKHAFETLLEQKGDDPALRALCQNNIAWTDLMISDPELLQQADRLSSEALQLLPWMPECKGTRGSVLIDLGRLDEGIALLEDAMQHNSQKANQAYNACYLALAMLRRGDLENAAEYYEAAVRLDPKCCLLGRVEAEREGRCLPGPKSEGV